VSHIFDMMRKLEGPGEDERGNEGDGRLGVLADDLKQARTVEFGGDDHETRLLTGPDAECLAEERFRLLAHRLCELRTTRNQLQKVLVTSSVPGEGKTTVALNLANTLGRDGGRVLLVDADLRKGVEDTEGRLPILPGWGDVLEGRERTAQVICRLMPLGLYYLPAGTAHQPVTELFQNRRLAPLLAALCAVFDWMVLDSSPVNLYADSLCLAATADATLLVVRPDRTVRSDFEEALAALGGVFLAGVVMNGCNDRRASRYYQYPRRNGHRAEHRP
jgi:capsular exopolysaccharide synthesis family protein